MNEETDETSPAMPAEVEPDTAQPPKKKRTLLWVIVGVIAVVLLGVVYSAGQSGGAGWLLLFRGVEVPQVVGMKQADAQAALSSAQLRMGQVSEAATLAVAPGIVVAQAPAASTKVAKDSSVDVTVSVVPTATVPNVVGQTESQASATLAEEGIPVGDKSYVNDSSVKPGYVKAQSPDAGSQVKVGTTVSLTVSKGPQTGTVPNVVGLSQSDAQSTLSAAGFKSTVTNASSADVPAGDVMSQSPAAGLTANTGSNVTITVSKGAPPKPAEPTSTPAPPADQPSTPNPPAEQPSEKVSVPDVIGMRVLEAVRTLSDAELKFTITFVKVSGNYLRIATQDPSADAKVEPGTAVTIGIGLPGFLFGGGGELPSRPETETPTVAPLPSQPSMTPSNSGTSSDVTTP